MLIAAFRTCLRLVFALSFVLAGLFLAAIATTGPSLPAHASEIAVDCAAVAISFEAKDQFSLTCEAKTTKLAGMGDGSAEEQQLRALAKDGQTLLNAIRVNLLGRVYFTRSDLLSNFHDFYEKIEINNWQDGRSTSHLTTAEFSTHLVGVPSKCLAFQKLENAMWGGHKTLTIGFSCSRGDFAFAYDTLAHLHLADEASIAARKDPDPTKRQR